MINMRIKIKKHANYVFFLAINVLIYQLSVFLVNKVLKFQTNFLFKNIIIIYIHICIFIKIKYF
jgi:hypothetical protein